MSIDANTLKQIIAQVVQEMTTEDSVAVLLAAELTVAASISSGTTTMTATATGKLVSAETGPAEHGSNPKKAVVAIPPAFSTLTHETIIGLPYTTVLKEITTGIREEGLKHRFMKVYKTTDVGFIAHQAAKLSGSDIGIGTQSCGTTVTHQKDLPPLSSVELFSRSSPIDLEIFRATGKSAAKYAKGKSPQPMPIRNGQMVRPKCQAVAALLHNKETAQRDLVKKSRALRVSTA